MNIEVGKFYKTRDSRKARIYALDGDGIDCIHGAVSIEGKWRSRFWLPTGGVCPDEESGGDLIAPWVDRPEFDRNLLPAWCNKAIAMDQDGSWYCFQATPYLPSNANAWRAQEPTSYIKVPETHAPKWEGDWKQSLLVFEDEQKGEG